jgi:radical SAM superfamily enzyme YgiQ (UPF0313 family)
MRIFFSNPPWSIKNRYGVRAGSRWSHTIEEGSRIKYFPFPFWLAYSTAILEKEGFKVFLKDSVAEESSLKNLFSEIKRFKPDLVVMEPSTPSFNNDLQIAKEIKQEFGCEICFTGSHVSVLPEESLKNSIDYVCIGEYDYTIRDLVVKLEKGENPKDVAGLAFKESGKVQVNARRDLIENLDELPYPARHFLPMKKYNDLFCKGFPNIPMISSRGCPFNCSFCLEPVFYGKPNYRYRSAKNVVDEMEHIIENYSPEEIYFDDATFTIGEKRVVDICDEILNRKLDIMWSCMGHASISKEVLKKMKQAGCRAIKIGVESASKQILKNANKSVNLKMVKDCVKNCKDVGLEVHATYMIGLPSETKETIRKTIEFALSLKTDTCQFSIATPLPGTKFYETVKNKGWLKAERWEEFDGNFSVVVEYPQLSREEIQRGFQYCKRKYFLSKLKDIPFVMKVLGNTYKSEGFFKAIRAISEAFGEVTRG